MKRTPHIAATAVCVMLMQLTASGQYSLPWILNNPRTTASYGLGAQGVASSHPADGHIWNPAVIGQTNFIAVDYYRLPCYLWRYLPDAMRPSTGVAASVRVSESDVAGLDFGYQNLGIVQPRTDENPFGRIAVNAYDYSVSASIAHAFTEELTAGFQVKFSRAEREEYHQQYAYLGCGLLYLPAALEQRLTVGWSLTNLAFGQWYEAPTTMEFGFHVLPVKTAFVTAGIEASLSKRFVAVDGEKREPESGFQALLRHWRRFPNDCDDHIGVSFEWRPIQLGGGTAVQYAFYTGKFAWGLSSESVYTFGIETGFSYGRVSFMAGLASRWAISDVGFLPEFVLPFESYHFAVRYASSDESKNAQHVQRVVLSAGAGSIQRIGALRSMKTNNIANNNSAGFRCEAALYVSDQSALVASITADKHLGTSNAAVLFEQNRRGMGSIEDISLFTSYRWHPVNAWRELFTQFGGGVRRSNPFNNTSMDYTYDVGVTAGVGALIPVVERIHLIPAVHWVMMFENICGGPTPHMQAFHQFEFGLQAGYAFH